MIERVGALVAERPLREAVHRRLLAAPFDPAALGGPELRARLSSLLRDEAPLVTDVVAARVLDDLVAEVDGLGPLQLLFADPTISEIMVNGPHRVFVERNGRLEPFECELDADAIVRISERVIAPLGLRLDRASPMVDARLADGSRLHAVLPPLAPDGPCLTIRRFSPRSVALADFGLDESGVELLETMVRAGWNLLVSGATSAGKTTCANALVGAVDPAERIVTIEETAELRLRQPHVVRLESRPANAEGAGAVSVRELVRAALRMRPDRLVVGEVRGAEAFDMLQALNTGHDGSVSTIHANSPVDALARLETLVLLAGIALPLSAVRAQLASAVDAIVQVARGEHGARMVVAVAEVGATRDDGALGVRTLLDRQFGALVAVDAPRAAGAARGFRPRGGVVRLRLIVVALIGNAGVVLLVRSARRFAVADRLRPIAGVRTLPAGLRRPLTRALDDAAVTWSAELAVEMWALAIVVAVLIGAGIAPATGVLAGGGMLIGGPVALRLGRHRRERLVAAAVPDTLELIGSELRAGGTVATALAGVAAGEGVLALDMARVETRVRLGAGLPEALQSWARERRAFGVDAAAGALALSTSVGGPAADALDGLASSLRDRLSVIAESRALSTQARYSAWVIGLAPVGYIVSTAAVDPRSVRLLVGTNAGRCCAVAGLGLELLGATWMRAIVRGGEAT